MDHDTMMQNGLARRGAGITSEQVRDARHVAVCSCGGSPRNSSKLQIAAALITMAAACLFAGCSTSGLRDLVEQIPTASNAVPVVVEPSPAPAPAPAPEPVQQQEFKLSWTHEGNAKTRIEAWPLWATECRSVTVISSTGTRYPALTIGGTSQKFNAVMYATFGVHSGFPGLVTLEIDNVKFGLLRWSNINPAVQAIYTIRK